MKKVLSIVLSLVMVICMMPVMAFAATSNAAYSDISGEKCEGAVNVLDALGVVDGYEDGTYRPDQTVTRAEMAKLIITALGVADYASATNSSYSDMALAQWAIPYVEYATNLNIVEGVGGGRFSPGNPVTYEQAVTMIVRALGYTTDCNEMNGTWPAVYVQKATALGIFKNVEGNQYGTGANRGDVAIMLYNALDIPQVYADKDGETHYKQGEYNSETKDYARITMMSILNKDGESKYQVVTSQMADDAVTDIRAYIGAAAKVTTDKNDHVIAVGDIQTTFLSGKVSNDGKKFTVGDTEYTLPTSEDSYVDVNASTGGKGEKQKADQIKNGETSTVSDFKGTLKPKAKVTIAAKVSGKTIKEIYSVADWTVTKAAVISDSQINTIKNKQTLLGYDFTLNDDREIDMTSFELVGVDSLDKIEKDDIVYVYTGTDKEITRVAVGQQVVNAELTKVTSNEKYTVDGTEYKLAAKETAGISESSPGYSIASDVKAGDEVELSLDAYGYIYKLEADSANRLYAAVLKTGKDTDAYNETTYSLQFLNSAGETVVANVDDDYENDYAKVMGDTAGAVKAATIVKYHLNSSNEIDYIEKVNAGNNAVEKKVSSSGYYNGYELASNVVIFSYNGDDYSKADNYTVVSRESAIGKEFSASYALNGDDKIVLMIADDLVANDVIFGLVTGSGSNNSDAGYYIDVLTPDGKTASYDCSMTVMNGILSEAGSDDLKNLMGFKVSSNNEIKSGNYAKVVTEDKFLGGDDVLAKTGKVDKIENGRITLKDSDAGSYGYTNDVVIYKYDADDNKYKADGDTSDIETGKTVAMFDIDGEDSVYDVVVIFKA